MAHELKQAYLIPRRKGLSYSVTECECGWSSKLYGSQLRALEAHDLHVRQAWAREATAAAR